MHPFRAAVEARDIDAIPALLADDVTFLSPVVFRPYHGREVVTHILRAVARVFEDFRYERELVGGGGSDHALLFRARIGDREVQGCDFLRTDGDGRIAELCVMVRPLSAAHALADAMGRELQAP